MSTTIESPSGRFPVEVQEIVLLETLKELLTAAIRSLSTAGRRNCRKSAARIKATADEVRVAELNLGRLPLTSTAQQQRQKLLAELCQQRSFCREDAAAVAAFDFVAAATRSISQPER